MKEMVPAGENYLNWNLRNEWEFKVYMLGKTRASKQDGTFYVKAERVRSVCVPHG